MTFCCWQRPLPVCTTEGSAPVTHYTHTDIIFFGRECVYSVSVLIIRYLVEGFDVLRAG